MISSRDLPAHPAADGASATPIEPVGSSRPNASSEQQALARGWASGPRARLREVSSRGRSSALFGSPAESMGLSPAAAELGTSGFVMRAVPLATNLFRGLGDEGPLVARPTR
ncbi:MAG TPA: hypothetical protein DFS52_15845 [Myxococcales bacterium]|nr:hypothetical protein [Myxococcales bacterium]